LAVVEGLEVSSSPVPFEPGICGLLLRLIGESEREYRGLSALGAEDRKRAAAKFAGVSMFELRAVRGRNRHHNATKEATNIIAVLAQRHLQSQDILKRIPVGLAGQQSSCR
jgi:hypothetical protein